MSVKQSERTLSNFLAYLDELRGRGDVHFDEKIQAWHVLGYHDTYQVLTDPVTYSSDVAPLAPKQEDFDLFKKGNFVRADDPAHRRLRGMVSRAFTPKMIADLEPRITEVTMQLLDDADARGNQWDLIEELGYPLPFIVIAEMLGIPVTDRAFVRRLSDTFFEVHNVDPEASLDELGESAVNNVAPLLRELNLHLLEFVRDRRKNPGDDLTSKLLAVEVDGARLDDEETVGFLGLLLLAGHVTATSTVGNTVLALHENPEVWGQLRADPGLIPAAIEESMRYRPPFPRLGRQVTKDTEIGGQKIPADAFVLAWLTTANRDERVFANPDRFDIHRDSNPHLTFGKGMHFCLGAPLARLEVKIAMRILMERYSDIRVRDDVPVNLRNPWAMIGVNRLPIEVRRF
ncbi:cytochrome P450 [Amycolatopsis sp. WAC 01375]|uniref:cytochrome P450 n=1 Tax=Amycolatopsis sp. WAC 01375 TaxID=2203194 RepID=UPI000F7B4D92|nr:cytochrome P450 [Amycolatopsis sp. WAC 01375]RSM75234.1 cytochrome P450 [Amycolatopsis sp. WAC 01375]